MNYNITRLTVIFQSNSVCHAWSANVVLFLNYYFMSRATIKILCDIVLLVNLNLISVARFLDFYIVGLSAVASKFTNQDLLKWVHISVETLVGRPAPTEKLGIWIYRPPDDRRQNVAEAAMNVIIIIIRRLALAAGWLIADFMLIIANQLERCHEEHKERVWRGGAWRRERTIVPDGGGAEEPIADRDSRRREGKRSATKTPD